jgi:hypothetical protein
MNRRIATATRIGFREQARRPLAIALLVVTPFFFITMSVSRTTLLPRRVGLPGGLHVVTTMRDVHGVTMAAITVSFLAGLCGAFIIGSSRQADRRLIVAGFRPFEAVIPRLAALVAAVLIVVAVSVAVTALSFTPQSWFVFALGTLLIGLIYGSIGILAGSLMGPLGATYFVLFMALLGQGILQSPMFGSGTPKGLALFFPDYGATRVIVGAGFSSGFHASGELALSVAWIVVLGSFAVFALRQQLRRAT